MGTGLVVASLHLFALGVGLGGLWSRARALHDAFLRSGDRRALSRAYAGNAWWSAAVLLWLTTGVWWLASGTENIEGLYSLDAAFLGKMALFAAVVGFEVWPTTKFVRWRLSRKEPIPSDLRRVEAISYVQCALVVGIVVAAASSGVAHGAKGATTIETARTSPPREREATGEVAPILPSGTATVTRNDVALLTGEIAMPLRGIDPDSLHSSFNASRAGGLRRHEALDIMAPRFTPILSAAKGRVLKLFTSVAGGLMVYAADSSERFILMYAHLDHYAPGIRDGMRLERGELIGYVGSTGNASATAPHLHFAILRSADVKRWSKGTAIDPLPILKDAAHTAHP
jgi:peptidoglycan LD-endopeptidase LytH